MFIVHGPGTVEDRRFSTACLRFKEMLFPGSRWDEETGGSMSGKRHGPGAWKSLAILFGCFLTAPLASMAQSGEVPRTAWGAPDLGGVWDYRTATQLQRPEALAHREFFTEEEAREFGAGANERLTAALQEELGEAELEAWFDVGDRPADGNRTALIIDPPNGRIPERTEIGKERMRELGPLVVRAANGPEDLGLSTRCLTFRNVPIRILPYNNNVHIFQTPDIVAILSEMAHEVRIIPLDSRPPLGTSVPQWLGNSRGWWEGETLVIETTGFDERSTFQGAGPSLRLIERLTRVDADTLRYDYTINDPESFTSPWTVDHPMKRSEAPLFEYACHEGNRAMVNILSFARAEEAEK